MLLFSALTIAGLGLVYSAPFSGILTRHSGNAVHIPRHAFFTDSLGEPILTDPVYSRNAAFHRDLNMKNEPHNMNGNMGANDGVLVRRRRLADDKKLDLKMKMQRVKKVVSLDAIGSYSLYRSDDRKTSLKAFGSTELWYDGTGFGLKKPGLGVQFTIYY